MLPRFEIQQNTNSNSVRDLMLHTEPQSGVLELFFDPAYNISYLTSDEKILDKQITGLFNKLTEKHFSEKLALPHDRFVKLRNVELAILYGEVDYLSDSLRSWLSEPDQGKQLLSILQKDLREFGVNATWIIDRKNDGRLNLHLVGSHLWTPPKTLTLTCITNPDKPASAIAYPADRIDQTRVSPNSVEKIDATEALEDIRDAILDKLDQNPLSGNKFTQPH
jgi:hypothetical protein